MSSQLILTKKLNQLGKKNFFKMKLRPSLSKAKKAMSLLIKTKSLSTQTLKRFQVYAQLLTKKVRSLPQMLQKLMMELLLTY
jgi:hypothetical protein